MILCRQVLLSNRAIIVGIHWTDKTFHHGLNTKANLIPYLSPKYLHIYASSESKALLYNITKWSFFCFLFFFNLFRKVIVYFNIGHCTCVCGSSIMKASMWGLWLALIRPEASREALFANRERKGKSKQERSCVRACVYVKKCLCMHNDILPKLDGDE